MALVLWSDNFGISMVLVFFFWCVIAEDANDGAKLKKNGNKKQHPAKA
jgi:hypothetical protein